MAFMQVGILILVEGLFYHLLLLKEVAFKPWVSKMFQKKSLHYGSPCIKYEYLDIETSFVGAHHSYCTSISWGLQLRSDQTWAQKFRKGSFIIYFIS